MCPILYVATHTLFHLFYLRNTHANVSDSAGSVLLKILEKMTSHNTQNFILKVDEIKNYLEDLCDLLDDEGLDADYILYESVVENQMDMELVVIDENLNEHRYMVQDIYITNLTLDYIKILCNLYVEQEFGVEV